MANSHWKVQPLKSRALLHCETTCLLPGSDPGLSGAAPPSADGYTLVFAHVAGVRSCAHTMLFNESRRFSFLGQVMQQPDRDTVESLPSVSGDIKHRSISEASGLVKLTMYHRAVHG